MLHLLCPLVVCGECPESGLSGLGVATSITFTLSLVTDTIILIIYIEAVKKVIIRFSITKKRDTTEKSAQLRSKRTG